jgi:hypothetical protein
MSETNQNKGVTIRELKKFLSSLPAEFDDFGMVNGEVLELNEEYFVRTDKPILHLELDEENKEFLLLHQTKETLEDILKQMNGNSERPKQ